MKESALAASLASFSFIMTIIWGGPLLRVLRHFKIGKLIRVEEPSKNQVKMGTPTMGGVMIIVPVLLITILLNSAELVGFQFSGKSVFVPMLTMVVFALLGAYDDWEGIHGKRKGDGISARLKFGVQWGLALGIGWILKYVLDAPGLYIPGVNTPVQFGVWFVPVAAFIIVAMSNAINLTDGLDGLAGLVSATIFAAYAMIALLQHQIFLAQFSFTLVGALFGFLWFNVHPAQLFMGDAGALSLGATIAVVALMTGQWAILPLIAVIPLAETISVIIQVTYFKATKGRRFFKQSPIHYHFELIGWSETQVVQRFWLISLLAAMVGVGLALA